MVTIILLTQRYELNRRSRYFGSVHQAHQKVSGNIRKSFNSIMSKNRSSKLTWNILTKLLLFELRLISNASTIFPVNFMKRLSYLKGPLDLYLCVSKTIVIIRHSNVIIFPISSNEFLAPTSGRFLLKMTVCSN